MARARTVVVAAISLAYPVLVYLAMGRFEPRWLSLLLFPLALLPAPDQLMIARLKRKKLALRDDIVKLQDQILPDIIA